MFYPINVIEFKANANYGYNIEVGKSVYLIKSIY